MKGGKERIEEYDNLTFEDVASIFSAVAHPDALKIYMEMKDGISSSTKIIKKLGLTQKRYYSRLRELISAGLVEKREEGYGLTVLGEALYRLGFYMLDILANRDRLTLLSQLIESEKLSDAEKKKIVKTLDFNSKYLSIEDLYAVKKVLKVVDTYEDLVKTVSESFDRAEKEVRIASRYTPMQVAEKVHDAMVRGVRMDWIDGDKVNLSNKLQIMKLVFMNPRAVVSFYEAMSNPNNTARFYPDLPYSLMVVDGKFGAFEIIDPVTEKFIFAIFFEDQDLCGKLNEVFDRIKEKAVEHPYMNLASKFKKLKL